MFHFFTPKHRMKSVIESMYPRRTFLARCVRALRKLLVAVRFNGSEWEYYRETPRWLKSCFDILEIGRVRHIDFVLPEVACHESKNFYKDSSGRWWCETTKTPIRFPGSLSEIYDKLITNMGIPEDVMQKMQIPRTQPFMPTVSYGNSMMGIQMALKHKIPILMMSLEASPTGQALSKLREGLHALQSEGRIVKRSGKRSAHNFGIAIDFPVADESNQNKDV